MELPSDLSPETSDIVSDSQSEKPIELSQESSTQTSKPTACDQASQSLEPSDKSPKRLETLASSAACDRIQYLQSQAKDYYQVVIKSNENSRELESVIRNQRELIRNLQQTVSHCQSEKDSIIASTEELRQLHHQGRTADKTLFDLEITALRQSAQLQTQQLSATIQQLRTENTQYALRSRVEQPSVELNQCWNQNCDKPDCTLKCSLCSKALYCSKECQKKHWKIHKKDGLCKK